MRGDFLVGWRKKSGALAARFPAKDGEGARGRGQESGSSRTASRRPEGGWRRRPEARKQRRHWRRSRVAARAGRWDFRWGSSTEAEWLEQRRRRAWEEASRLMREPGRPRKRDALSQGLQSESRVRGAALLWRRRSPGEGSSLWETSEVRQQRQTVPRRGGREGARVGGQDGGRGIPPGSEESLPLFCQLRPAREAWRRS